MRITDAKDIPYQVAKAVKMAVTGRPGPVFLDLPGDILMTNVDAELKFSKFIAPVGYAPLEEEISKAVKLLGCLLYTSPSPRDLSTSRMPSSA